MKSHRCSQCDYASSDADVVRSHVIAQSGEKSQNCNKCEYLVSHANTLKVHMKVHPGENDVKCKCLGTLVMALRVTRVWGGEKQMPKSVPEH